MHSQRQCAAPYDIIPQYMHAYTHPTSCTVDTLRIYIYTQHLTLYTLTNFQFSFHNTTTVRSKLECHVVAATQTVHSTRLLIKLFKTVQGISWSALSIRSRFAQVDKRDRLQKLYSRPVGWLDYISVLYTRKRCVFAYLLH